MRVMLVSSYYPPDIIGGAELVVTHLAEALAGLGVSVTVVATCAPDAQGLMEPGLLTEEIRGVRVLRFFPRNLWWNRERFREGDRRSILDRIRWHARDAWNPHTAEMFRRILSDAAPDILHSHVVKGFSPAVWYAARAAGIPVVHTAHDYGLICFRGNMVGRDGAPCDGRCAPCRIYRPYGWHGGLIDRLCCPSRFSADRHRAAGQDPDRIVVVRNGVPAPAGRAPLRTAEPDGPLRLSFIGRLSEDKGIRTLLGIMERLPRRVDARLVVCGDGPLTGEVEAAARADARIAFIGRIAPEEIDLLLRQSDLMLFPSLWFEGAPLILANAVRAATPVLASDLGAMPELVAHGRTGWLAPPGDVSAWVAVLERLAADRSELDRVRRHLEAGPGWPDPTDMARAYLAVYAAALARVRRAA